MQFSQTLPFHVQKQYGSETLGDLIFYFQNETKITI
jgi:hypothetical protein